MSDFYKRVTGGYSRTGTYAAHNAQHIREVLTPWGWSLNAICGLLGNIEVESGYNPWRWQGDAVLASTSPNIDISSAHAYGLFQFDPAGKYIHSPIAQQYAGYAPNFSDVTGLPSDGDAQLQFINEGHGGYYATAAYPLSFGEFRRSRQSAEYLAAAWLSNYERPADPSATLAVRQEAAAYWWQYFGGQPSPDLMPIWLMGGYLLRKRKRRMRL